MSAVARFFIRFRRDRRGTAALEFALIAPLILFVILGSVELTNAINTWKRVENTGASIADVVSRDTAVTDDELEDLWNAINPLMSPSNPLLVRMRLTSVSVVSATRATVVWSEGHGMTAYNDGEDLPEDKLPDELMIPGVTVIVTDIEYPYEPALPFVFGDGGLHEVVGDGTSADRGGFIIRDMAVRRSRLVDPIPRI